ncbi:hypothetical protein TRAPUB_6646 [Trametes pubescens]|uniref:BTB domain-containing protein n=1 Tax=Trametes pubescens TaxID=154538 RepID=A0A1M2V592_TRAPU|nr:hypothetical protein TRAPUB_6646 [Trametes pubescens]
MNSLLPLSTPKSRGQKRLADSELQSTPSETTPSSTSSKCPRTADTIAPAPFNAEDADLVIRSSTENICFKVHKAILNLASPVLTAAIAALPNPSDGSAPELRLPEPGDVLTHLLRFLYPVSDPDMLSPEDVVNVYTAVIKYDVSYVTTTLQRMLVSPRFLDAEPLRVHALAKRFRLDELARLASNSRRSAPASHMA